VDSGIDRLSRQSSLSSLNVTEEMGRINLDASPLVKTEFKSVLDNNLEHINKHNREAKINPDNSVLVEVRLTAEQYELVSSGKYIVSLCDARTLNAEAQSLRLPNWNLSTGGESRPVKQEREPPRGQSIPIQNRHDPFSPHSSESSGMGNSYSPPPRTSPGQVASHQTEINQPIYSHSPIKNIARSENLPDSSDIQFINCITGDNLFDQFELPDTDLADILDYGGQ
jgi:hypothetical protein